MKKNKSFFKQLTNKNKTVLFLLLILLTISTKAQTYVSYNNEEWLGLSIEYPENWLFKESKKYNTIAINCKFSKFIYTYDGGFFIKYLPEYDSIGTFCKIKELEKEIDRTISEEGNLFDYNDKKVKLKKLTKRYKTINNIPSIEYNYSYKRRIPFTFFKEKIIVKENYIIKNNRVYVVALALDEVRVEVYKSEINSIFDSIKFINLKGVK